MPVKKLKNASRLGSQRLLQLAVEHYPDLLEGALFKAGTISRTETVTWTSPLKSEGFKEYRDLPALDKLGVLNTIIYPLKDFWPQRGPVWDAIGISSYGTPILLEAKAHIPEAASPSSKASQESLQLIEASLEMAHKFYSSRSTSRWSSTFYQYANRLAHHYYLRELNKIPSVLVFLNFINAIEMGGPTSVQEWKGAIRLLHAVLGLPPDLKSYGVYHAYIDAKLLSQVE